MQICEGDYNTDTSTWIYNTTEDNLCFRGSAGPLNCLSSTDQEQEIAEDMQYECSRESNKANCLTVIKNVVDKAITWDKKGRTASVRVSYLKADMCRTGSGVTRCAQKKVIYSCILNAAGEGKECS